MGIFFASHRNETNGHWKRPIVRSFRSVIFIIHLDHSAVALVAERGVVFIGRI